MKYIRIVISILLASVASFCLADVYTVETGQFEKLKINGNIRVVYKNLPDSTGFARYFAPEGNGNIFVFSTKKDGTLKVEPSDEKWGQTGLPVVHVYSDFLTSVESYSEQAVEILSVAPNSVFTVTQVGNGTITVDNLKSNTVKATINTGNGAIYLSGDCVNALFRMVGSGLISADKLVAEDVKCRVIGTGSITCWPVDNLTVAGLGTTKIYYKGKPNISRKLGGKLFELPGDIQERRGTPVHSLAPPADDDDDDSPYDYPERLVDSVPEVVAPAAAEKPTLPTSEKPASVAVKKEEKTGISINSGLVEVKEEDEDTDDSVSVEVTEKVTLTPSPADDDDDDDDDNEQTVVTDDD